MKPLNALDLKKETIPTETMTERIFRKFIESWKK